MPRQVRQIAKISIFQFHTGNDVIKRQVFYHLTQHLCPVIEIAIGLWDRTSSVSTNRKMWLSDLIGASNGSLRGTPRYGKCAVYWITIALNVRYPTMQCTQPSTKISHQMHPNPYFYLYSLQLFYTSKLFFKLVFKLFLSCLICFLFLCISNLKLSNKRFSSGKLQFW